MGTAYARLKHPHEKVLLHIFGSNSSVEIGPLDKIENAETFGMNVRFDGNGDGDCDDIKEVDGVEVDGAGDDVDDVDGDDVVLHGGRGDVALKEVVVLDTFCGNSCRSSDVPFIHFPKLILPFHRFHLTSS